MDKYFDEGDIDLLVNVVQLIPDLAMVAHAAKLVRQRGKYPIESVDALLGLIADESIDLAGVTIHKVQVLKFVPSEFFPIESERDLLCRLLIAFQRGAAFHALEVQVEQWRKGNTDEDRDTLLPGPAPYSLSARR